MGLVDLIATYLFLHGLLPIVTLTFSSFVFAEVLLDTTKSNGQQRLSWTKKVIEPDPPDPSNAGVSF